jgi:hypothetical protein
LACCNLGGGDGVLAVARLNSHIRTLTAVFPATAGAHNLTILSESLGIYNGMNANSTGKVKGIVGTVTFGGHNISSNTYVL